MNWIDLVWLAPFGLVAWALHATFWRKPKTRPSAIEVEAFFEHGRRLTGQHLHYCPDWDGMPIDETCKEYRSGCVCYGGRKLLTWKPKQYRRT